MARGVGDTREALELWVLEPALKTVLGPTERSARATVMLLEPSEATPEPLTLPKQLAGQPQLSAMCFGEELLTEGRPDPPPSNRHLLSAEGRSVSFSSSM